MLLAGIGSCAVVLLILALVLTVIDWEWDGPVLWDRVSGWTMCLAAIGIVLVAIGYAMLTDRHPPSQPSDNT